MLLLLLLLLLLVLAITWWQPYPEAALALPADHLQHAPCKCLAAQQLPAAAHGARCRCCRSFACVPSILQRTDSDIDAKLLLKSKRFHCLCKLPVGRMLCGWQSLEHTQLAYRTH
jgi:hypothetical protein